MSAEPWIALAVAARSWSPDAVDVGERTGCCVLCFVQRAALTRSPAFDRMPHAVVHPAIVAFDERIRREVEVAEREAEDRVWMSPWEGQDPQRRIEAEARAAELAAENDVVQEIWDHLADLERVRRIWIDPAVAAHLARHRVPVEVPRQWLT